MKIENRLQSKNLSKIQKIFAYREKYFVTWHLRQCSTLCHDTARRVAPGCIRSTLSHYANGLNCTKCIKMFCYKCGKEYDSNELFCRRCDTLKRPEQKNVLHSSSDERSAIEQYFERGFRYNTIVQFLEKEVIKGPSISRLIISRTLNGLHFSFSRNLLFKVFKFIEIPWYFSKNWTKHRRQNSSFLSNSFPNFCQNIAIHLVLLSLLAYWLQVDLIQPNATLEHFKLVRANGGIVGCMCSTPPVQR